MGKGGTWYEEVTYCNARTDQTILTNGFCVIPMAVFFTAPYSLSQGDEIIAKILAANILGDSEYSAESVVRA